MTVEPSEAVKRGIAARYAEGESLEDLALDWEVNPRRLRDWIAPYVEIRSKGYRSGTVSRAPAPGPRPTGVHSSPSVGARSTHRRRGNRYR